MAQLTQSKPDSDLGFQVKLRSTFPAVPSFLRGGQYLGSQKLGVGVSQHLEADLAHIRQSKPDSGIGFQVKLR